MPNHCKSRPKDPEEESNGRKPSSNCEAVAELGALTIQP